MSAKQLFVALISLVPLLYGAADVADKIALLDCTERKTAALPGAAVHRTWIAHHMVLPVAGMSDEFIEAFKETLTPSTTKMLRCYIGYVEGQDGELVGRASIAVSQDLHPQNEMWHYPFDESCSPDLKQFVTDADVAEQIEKMKAKLFWFHCTDDNRSPRRRDVPEGIVPFRSLMLPNSFKEPLVEALIAQDESGNAIERYAESAKQKNELPPEVFALLDTYSREQEQFHGSSYRILNPERFAAFAAQAFQDR